MAREVLPNAQIGFYGSPNGPSAYKDENFTESMEGLYEASRPGLFDDVSFLVPVLYFGSNVSRGERHTQQVEGWSNTTLAAAMRVRTSSGRELPMFVNTKFTYAGGPLQPPYEGWVEPSTTHRLVQLWRTYPRVRRIMYVVQFSIFTKNSTLLLATSVTSALLSTALS